MNERSNRSDKPVVFGEQQDPEHAGCVEAEFDGRGSSRGFVDEHGVGVEFLGELDGVGLADIEVFEQLRDEPVIRSIADKVLGKSLDLKRGERAERPKQLPRDFTRNDDFAEERGEQSSRSRCWSARIGEVSLTTITAGAPGVAVC